MIIDWLKQNPIINTRQLEQMAGVPRNTVANALTDYRSLPEKHRPAVERILRQYGYRPAPPPVQSVHLLNSATMPSGGAYHLWPVAPAAFFEAVQAANKAGKLISSIGYQQNIDLIRQNTGVEPDLSREPTNIAHLDRLLIMRLKYRPDAGTKGRGVDPHDFEYFSGVYAATFPVPALHDVEAMDIYEPSAWNYIQAVLAMLGADLEEIQAARHQITTLAEEGEEALWRKYTQMERQLWKTFF